MVKDANNQWRDIHENRMITKEMIWLAIGFLGQILFSLRFLIQWITSEMKRSSVIPMSFWYFSIAGSVTLLSYAIYRQDPVFIVGQLFGLIVYGRNIRLIQNATAESKDSADVAG